MSNIGGRSFRETKSKRQARAKDSKEKLQTPSHARKKPSRRK